MKPPGPSALRVLAAVDRDSAYGFDIMDQTGLKSGTVYRALSRLESLGLVQSRWEEPRRALADKRPRRRYYELTPAGHACLAEAHRDWLGFARGLAPEPPGA